MVVGRNSQFSVKLRVKSGGSKADKVEDAVVGREEVTKKGVG